jgi:hypothetical protein
MLEGDLTPRGRKRRRKWRMHGAGDTDEIPPFSHRYLTVSRLPGQVTADLQYRLMRGERFDKLTGDSDFFDEVFADSIQEVWRDYATQELVDIRKIQQKGLADILGAVIGREGRRDAKSDDHKAITAEQATRAVRRFFQAQEIQLPTKVLNRLLNDYSSDSLLRQVVSQIVEVQELVDIAQEPTRKIEKLIAGMFSGGKRAFFTPRHLTVMTPDKKSLPLASLSSGEKQLLRLLVECRVAGDGVILIDEPELSMHVNWQHDLLQSMQMINPDAQIVVATHSPEIMAQIGDDKIFEL